METHSLKRNALFSCVSAFSETFLWKSRRLKTLSFLNWLPFTARNQVSVTDYLAEEIFMSGKVIDKDNKLRATLGHVNWATVKMIASNSELEIEGCFQRTLARY
ncbi:hypothetical protein TNCV_3462361 [Trichonephila clavipes]|nr:hypothetical protein TNCV_3462361 [Trichonephila clavipes]